jgi:hypothetical protein
MWAHHLIRHHPTDKSRETGIGAASLVVSSRWQHVDPATSGTHSYSEMCQYVSVSLVFERPRTSETDPDLHLFCAPSRTRTDTVRILSPLPLPIGL